MDQAVLASYGWCDALPPAPVNITIASSCGFGLVYLNTEEDFLLPPGLEERIASGDLYFPIVSEACKFQAQLRLYDTVKPRKKLPWRHRCPDAIRDDVLARLLALNPERYAEELAMRLQSKGGNLSAAVPADGRSETALARG